MILGILSDTHGDTRRTAAAIRILSRAGATAFVHCGDVGGAEVLDEFVGRQAWLIPGNTDGVDYGLEQYAHAVGLHWSAPPLRLELDGKVVVAFHGHEDDYARLLGPARRAAQSRAALGPIDYLLHGHTHVARDVRLGNLRVINPGALHRAQVHTAATLALARDLVRFWRVSTTDVGHDPVEFMLGG